MRPPRIDLTGTKFGKWTVLRTVGDTAGKKDRLWECRCDCGRVSVVRHSNMISGGSSKCYPCSCEERRKDPVISSARCVWLSAYTDGCTFEDFLILSQKNCHWCGSPPYRTYARSNSKTTSSEWRKVISEHPFIYNKIDNVWPCCTECNTARLDRTPDEFVSWIKKVYRHITIQEIEAA